MAQLSAWQDYTAHKLYLQQISILLTGKGIAYLKPLDPNLPLRPIEIEFENNRCCIKIHNTSDSTVEFLHGQEWNISMPGLRPSTNK